MLLCFSAALVLALSAGRGVEGRGLTFTADVIATTSSAPIEAPTGFDDETNGASDPSTHASDMGKFDEVEEIGDGLGPLYNAQACRECHQNPVSGGGSQVTELRVGHLDRFGRFVNPTVLAADGTVLTTGRSLINDRATCPEIQMQAPPGETIRTFRTSLNVLGDGFIEAIAESTLLDIAAQQRRETFGFIHGQPVYVDVLEAPGQKRIGRFGWKAQHASLLSFAADAYLNEMGFTSRLLPTEVVDRCNTQPGINDKVGDDGLADIDHFTRFMRSTKAPPRDPVLSATLDAQIGSDIFNRIGCDTCHVPKIVTAPAGSVINGGTFTVPDSLGNKIIHPYSDFLLHDIGTGDGIVQNGGPQSDDKLRTPPLWGLRARSRFMHDGESLTLYDAIRRHRGEALHVLEQYRFLTDQERQRVIAFLRSL